MDLHRLPSEENVSRLDNLNDHGELSRSVPPGLGRMSSESFDSVTEKNSIKISPKDNFGNYAEVDHFNEHFEEFRGTMNTSCVEYEGFKGGVVGHNADVSEMAPKIQDSSFKDGKFLSESGSVFAFDSHPQQHGHFENSSLYANGELNSHKLMINTKQEFHQKFSDFPGGASPSASSATGLQSMGVFGMEHKSASLGAGHTPRGLNVPPHHQQQSEGFVQDMPTPKEIWNEQQHNNDLVPTPRHYLQGGVGGEGGGGAPSLQPPGQRTLSAVEQLTSQQMSFQQAQALKTVGSGSQGSASPHTTAGGAGSMGGMGGSSSGSSEYTAEQWQGHGNAFAPQGRHPGMGLGRGQQKQQQDFNPQAEREYREFQGGYQAPHNQSGRGNVMPNNNNNSVNRGGMMPAAVESPHNMIETATDLEEIYRIHKEQQAELANRHMMQQQNLMHSHSHMRNGSPSYGRGVGGMGGMPGMGGMHGMGGNARYGSPHGMGGMGFPPQQQGMWPGVGGPGPLGYQEPHGMGGMGPRGMGGMHGMGGSGRGRGGYGHHHAPRGQYDALHLQQQQFGLTGIRAMPMNTSNDAVYLVQLKALARYHAVDINLLPPGQRLLIGEFVIIEADHGEDMGVVTEMLSMQDFQAKQRLKGGLLDHDDSSVGRIIRIAAVHERQQLPAKFHDEQIVVDATRQLARGTYAMTMTVVDAEYQFDRNKLIIYYDSSMRIDFRELVRDLFAAFKTRIWLKKYNVRHFYPKDFAVMALSTGMTFTPED